MSFHFAFPRGARGVRSTWGARGDRGVRSTRGAGRRARASQIGRHRLTHVSHTREMQMMQVMPVTEVLRLEQGSVVQEVASQGGGRMDFRWVMNTDITSLGNGSDLSRNLCKETVKTDEEHRHGRLMVYIESSVRRSDTTLATCPEEPPAAHTSWPSRTHRYSQGVPHHCISELTDTERYRGTPGGAACYRYYTANVGAGACDEQLLHVVWIYASYTGCWLCFMTPTSRRVAVLIGWAATADLCIVAAL